MPFSTAGLGEDTPTRRASRMDLRFYIDPDTGLPDIHQRDLERDSVFVITAYELTGKPLGAYRRRMRGRSR